MARDPNIKWIALRVYIIMASNRQKDGTAWCGLGRMALALDVLKPNVSKALKALQDGGYIVKMHQGGGRGNASLYRIVPPEKIIPRDTLSDDTADLETAQAEAPFFDHGVIPGDNERVSHGTPKYIHRDIHPPLPPLTGGEKDGPDGPTQRAVTVPDGHPRAAPDQDTIDLEERLTAEAAKGGQKDGAGAPPCRGPNAPKGRAPSPRSARLPARADRVQRFSSPSMAETSSEGYARDRIAEYIGWNNGAAGTLIAADDPSSPGHERAVKIVLEVAKKIGVRWAGPRHATDAEARP